MKPKVLYHGSPRKIKGNFLSPNNPQDLGKSKVNLIKGVYATHIRKNAIAMAIICTRGVISSSLNFYKRKKAIIYEGWPEQKYVYLYTLPSESFIRSYKKSTQWVSKEPVKPKRVEKLEVKKYLKSIRKATKKELENFFKKYGKTKIK